MQYTVNMYAEIERQIRRQQWFNQTMQWLWWTAWGVLIGILLCHRVFTIEGYWLLLSFVVVPLLTWMMQLRYTVPKQEVLHYAENVSGGTGLIWFDSAVENTDWSKEIDSTWDSVVPPVLQVPTETRASMFVSAMSIAMLLVPLRVESNTVYPTVVEKELIDLQEDVESFEALLDDVDPEVDAWKESLEQIEQGMSVGSTLRELDQMSEQLERRKQEAMESVEQAMDALDQGDEQQLTAAIESLQKQNMMSSSIKGPVNEDDAGDSIDQDQQTDGQSGTEGADQKTSGGQKTDSQQEQESIAQQQLQKQLEQLQQSLQKMAQKASEQKSSQSSSSTQQGMKSFTNDELQKMSEMGQKTTDSSKSSSQKQTATGKQGQQGTQSQESQSGQGNQEGKQEGQGQEGQEGKGQQGQGQEGTGEGQSGQSIGGSEKSNSSSGSPSDGGGTAPLTYGNSTLIPSTNMRALEGVPQVDWENSIAFGSTPGEAGEVQTVPVSTSGTSQSNGGTSIGQIQIPPQHRQTVQDFYAVDKKPSQ